MEHDQMDGAITPNALHALADLMKQHPELAALFARPTAALSAPTTAPKKRRGRQLPHFLRQAEEEALLAVCEKAVTATRSLFCKRLAMRDRLMVNLGLYCGLRVAEICSLRQEHIDLASATLLVKNGKGAKDRLLPIPERVLTLLSEWMVVNITEYLFTGEDRRSPVSTESIRCRFRVINKSLKLRFRLHPHVLRHTAASRLLQTGADIQTVREFLGHDDLRSTSVYLHCDPDRLRAAVETRCRAATPPNTPGSLDRSPVT